MDINLINEIGNELGYRRFDLIEKDLLLQQLLMGFSSNSFFSKNFAFKGGTCLIKAYAGYFRFSEDVDFTYLNQTEFGKKSGKEIRKILSKLITKTVKIIEAIASARKLDFKPSKSDRQYVELGGGGKMATFKIWYDSAVLKRKSFIKVQINFVETICFKPVVKKLSSLAVASKGDIERLYPEYKEYLKPLRFICYDKREIASEKIRAILTRRGIKARDSLDLYMLHKKFGIEPKDLEKFIIQKTKRALEMYGKYRDNLKEKSKMRLSLSEIGKEEEMLLVEIDKAEFYSFSKGLEGYLNELMQKL
ncbi:MAG TPA: nucleotidyl transferase AbiEii/AbiGii toxin family protein [Candidatus Aquilonibacter sp.]|nr:nucleotidyl transferase AbiEii/AbiGii toxin family protein [Candidatus Aquilonibacter sp.]